MSGRGSMNDAPPPLVVIDIELAAPVELGRAFLDDSKAAGPGIVGACRVDGARFWWMRADRASIHEIQAWTSRIGARGAVTWNGLRFDEPVLDAHLRRIWDDTGGASFFAAAGWRRHVDLCAIATLLDAGVEPSEIVRLGGVDVGWSDTWPYDVYRRHGGWSLGKVGEATLGREKHGLGGAEAPRAYRRGEIMRVVDYCRHDVALTRALYRHAWDGKPLVSARGRRVVIPRELLC